MKKLDWLATEVCDLLEENHGKGYAHDKRTRLAGLDRFKVLIWLNELDITNLEALAEKLDVDPEGLDFVRKFVRQL